MVFSRTWTVKSRYILASLSPRLLESSLIIVHRNFSVIFTGTPMHIHNLCDNTALSINARKTIFGYVGEKPLDEKPPRFVGCRANLRAFKMHSTGNIARQRNPRGQYDRNARKSTADFRVLSSLLCHCLCLPAPTVQLHGCRAVIGKDAS